jgi:hypothetical protein
MTTLLARPELSILADRDAFHDVAIGQLSGDLGEDRCRVRVPFHEHLA